MNLTEKELPRVIKLSSRIFNPIVGEMDKYEDKNIWYKAFKQNGLILGAFDNDIMIGFVFFFEKEKETKNIHCWMAGVDESYRGQGVLKSMMEIGEKQLKEKGYKIMTLNTITEKMPAMYEYLKKSGFTEYKQELREWDGGITTKNFFKKKI